MGKVGNRGSYVVGQPEIKGTILGVRQLRDRGRLQVPKVVREELGIRDGDGVYWIKGIDDIIYIIKATEIN